MWPTGTWSAISWILTSWKGWKRDARVCMKSLPFVWLVLHVSDGQTMRGVKLFCATSWKISFPHESQVYALTRRRGLTSETRVTIPRTVMRWPRYCAFTARTANTGLLRGGRKKTLLQSAPTSGISHKRRISSGGNCAEVSPGMPWSSWLWFHLALCSMMRSKTSSAWSASWSGAGLSLSRTSAKSCT